MGEETQGNHIRLNVPGLLYVLIIMILIIHSLYSSLPALAANEDKPGFSGYQFHWDDDSDNAEQDIGELTADGTFVYLYVEDPRNERHALAGYPDQLYTMNKETDEVYYGAVCGVNEEGNRLEDHFTDVEVSWSEIERICMFSEGQVEGDYVFRMFSDGLSSDEEDLSTHYLSALHVDYNSDYFWCTDCGVGESQYATGAEKHSDVLCCSPKEMDEHFNPNNEDCLNNVRIRSNKFLCYLSDNSSSTPLNEFFRQQGQWLQAVNMPGEIVFVGCHDDERTDAVLEGYEYLATSQDGQSGDWVKCTINGFDSGNAVKQPSSGYAVYDDPPTTLLTHEFICINWITNKAGDDRNLPRQHSIAECNSDGDRTNLLNYEQATDRRDGLRGGIVASGGQSVNVTTGGSRDTYFCANNNVWSTDLDSYDLAGENGVYCDTAKLPDVYNPQLYNPAGTVLGNDRIGSKWTGHYCCGEIDDWGEPVPEGLIFDTDNEYYNDDDRNPNGHYTSQNKGACFNNKYQANESYLEIWDKVDEEWDDVPEIIVWHGTFQGCAIDHTQAIASKEDNNPNDGKFQEDVRCANERADPAASFSGSFRGLASAQELLDIYGYTRTGNDMNDFLLQLRDHPNSGGGGNDQGVLIHDNEYCNIKEINEGGSAYVCSYTEQWEKVNNYDPADPPNHLNFIPWINDSVQQAGCCKQSECWDGEECVPSATDTLNPVPYKTMNTRNDGFICNDGDWVWIYRKTSWDGTNAGYCFFNSQCLIANGDYSVDPLGPQSYPSDVIPFVTTPGCINNGEYYLDHHCEDGTWTSRTKYIALELYNLMGPNENFTLYCDTYNKVLNFVDYATPQDFTQQVRELYFEVYGGSKCYSYNGEVVPCVNRVCVAIKNPGSTTPEVFFGTSLNHRLNISLSTGGEASSYTDFGRALGSTLAESASCRALEGASDTFEECEANIFFHGNKRLVILSRTLTLQNEDFVDVLIRLFTNFIETLIEGIAQPGAPGYDYSVLDQLAEQMYFDAYQTQPSIPDFECSQCHDHVDTFDKGDICGEDANPRKIFDLNTLLMARAGSKKIIGIAEHEAASDMIPVRYSGMVLEGFDFEPDFCPDLISSGYSCERVGNNYFVKYSTRIPSSPEFGSLVDLLGTSEQWVFLGPSTRIH